jgi:hypothetical protein
MLSGGGLQVKRTLVDELAWADSSLGEHVGANRGSAKNQKTLVCIHYGK